MGKRSKNDISQNPFKSLKGFCVSTPESSRPQEEKKLSAPPPKREPDDFTVFAEEMTRLGLPAPKRETGEAERKRAAAPASPPSSSPPSPRTDRELFLSALGGLDTIFSDEIPPENEEAVRAEPRRMRQVRQGRLAPEGELDLHGLTRVEARARVLFFLENAVHHGIRTVLLVTGRGLGSTGEPVLRAEVERLLAGEGRRWVSEWGKAPRQYGGEGALVVFLRGRKET